MRKLAVMLVFTMMFAVCSSVYTVKPAEAMLGLPPAIGAKAGKIGWGIVKGCWEAWKAPDGQKWEAFCKGYKEGTEDSSVAELAGGIIAY